MRKKRVIKKNGRYVKLVHQKEYDSKNDPLRVVRNVESRRIVYPFTRLTGRLRSRRVSKVARVGEGLVHTFNDKAN